MPKLTEEYPEIPICSRCGEHTEFTQGLDEDEGDWLSVCCTARAIAPDVELDDLEGVS